MKLISPILFLLFFSGCSLLNSQVNNTKNDSTDFRLLTTNLLPTTFCNKITPNSTLYVTDFVNESNLDNQSELGFLLSNELKVNLLKNNCSKNVMIKTFDLAQNLKMGRNGAKILTRELSKLKTQSIEDDKQIVIGSYSLTNKKIILFVKLVNLKDGNTIASNSSSDELTDEIKELEGIKDLDNSQSIKKPFHL